jgi:hypothetical protein
VQKKSFETKMKKSYTSIFYILTFQHFFDLFPFEINYCIDDKDLVSEAFLFGQDCLQYYVEDERNV